MRPNVGKEAGEVYVQGCPKHHADGHIGSALWTQTHTHMWKHYLPATKSITWGESLRALKNMNNAKNGQIRFSNGKPVFHLFLIETVICNPLIDKWLSYSCLKFKITIMIKLLGWTQQSPKCTSFIRGIVFWFSPWSCLLSCEWSFDHQKLFISNLMYFILFLHETFHFWSGRLNRLFQSEICSFSISHPPTEKGTSNRVVEYIIQSPHMWCVWD